MTVNQKTIIKMTGIMLVVLGLCMVPSMLVGVIYGEASSIKAFAVTIALCIAAGFAVYKAVGNFPLSIKGREGYLVVAICWALVCSIGTVPFVLSGAIPGWIDAFFECCSGISTSGATILDDIEVLPKSILFWRAFTHWMGGMGIIVFTAAILPSIGLSAQTIASAETPGPTLDKISARFSDTAKKLYKLYIAFTIAETIFLMIGGMSLYDALVHSFATVATGGYSPYNASVGHFTSPYIHWVIIIFMMMCGVNFNLYFFLAKKKVRDFLKDSEFRLYITLIAVTTALIVIVLMICGLYTNLFECVTDVAFQIVSVITTTGFAIVNYDVWPTFCRMLIFLLMIVGGCASSTGGGVKVIRVLVCIKLVRRGIALRLHPNRYVPVRINGKEIQQETATNIANFLFLYILTIFVGTLLISFDGHDVITNISATASCIGNYGPGFSMVGPTCTYSFFSGFSKLVLSFIMVAGRLELFTFIMLLSPHFWNSNRA